MRRFMILADLKLTRCVYWLSGAWGRGDDYSQWETEMRKASASAEAFLVW